MKPAPKTANERERIEALRATHLLDSETDFAFENLVQLARQVFSVPMVALSLLDDQRQWFKAAVGLSTCETDRDVSFCGHAVHHNSTFVVPDASNDERFHDNPLVTGSPYIRFYAGVPVRFSWQNKPYELGTFCVIDSKPRAFTHDQRELLGKFGRQAEALINMHVSNLQLERTIGVLEEQRQRLASSESQSQQLHVLANSDDLTGLLNRRWLMKTLREYELDKRYSGERVTFMLIDIDRFKTINDVYGHLAGDQVLQDFARILSTLLRRTHDHVCRLGGDEFAVLVDQESGGDSVTIAQALLEQVAHHNLNCAAHQHPFTISIGIATLPLNNFSALAIMREADHAMYQAKYAGGAGYRVSPGTTA
ncbi:MAG: sensor domain-containing diguanylate cyclase [Marinobacter sp.]|uniref:sensor domain-containing diguanylate cyclase n=1 Tax=Marinobacter sp. TaxID=50741 RepID=UPI00299CE073|nr:sensor domain-containing diguanylate cyclase [Marinobacter sp.]MDX1635223.1 sensor domain-containing diguanylate cyclase [Marinobacter sp.]